MSEVTHRLEQVLALHNLNEKQRQAVVSRDRDLLVTAGAGSGKTRTLVTRYLSLLAEGWDTRQVLAITFTKKAAREMRNRVRADLLWLQSHSMNPDERSFWEQLVEGIDMARIGTIHSLCAEILRAQPVEAALDPQFEVLDEGIAALLKVEAVDAALAWAAEEPDMLPLFSVLGIQSLQGLLSFLLERRLDVIELPAAREDSYAQLLQVLTGIMNSSRIDNCIQELEGLRASGKLESDAGGKLSAQVEDLLGKWQKAGACVQDENLIGAANALYTARRKYMRRNLGKRDSIAKAIIKDLQDQYDQRLDPWIGGARAGSESPDASIETRFLEIQPFVLRIFEQVEAYYREERLSRRALDFDDLEAGALNLLRNITIRARWQNEIQHILVDEFQDTNVRQRDIVLALAGDKPGKLFVVGDARQSIYRFRGADVTVFTGMQAEMGRQAGETIELDETFRSHKPLLEGLDGFLEQVMGANFEPDLPFDVPYSKLKAHRRDYDGPFQPPYIEVLLGVGKDAGQGRVAAARALADRLVELRSHREIHSWDQVALLFRASTGFPPYETALHAAGIPFLTIAGGGFYDRPEIRDLLNILTALADPWDDCALAGMLRSPAVGLSDAALYLLRGGARPARPLRQALDEYSDLLPKGEHPYAQRALGLFEELAPLVDHLPVGDLLTQLVNRLDYRAVLMTGGGRLVRNVDKLLDDAFTSQLVQVSAFLEYVRVVRDVDIRVGEAASQAADSVLLMTIHKAKGLEFDLVILADAGRKLRSLSEPAYLLPETRIAPRLGRLDGESLVYRYGKYIDRRQEIAEEKRLLYVACTRARQKLVLSGHVANGRLPDGFLRLLVEDAGLDINEAIQSPGEWFQSGLNTDTQVDIMVHTPDTVSNFHWQEQVVIPADVSHLEVLYRPLLQPARKHLADPDSEEDDLMLRDWRATGTKHAPALAVGVMVHRALQRWLFPGDEGYEALMRETAIREGLAHPTQRRAAVRETNKLLERFMSHELWAEIASAEIRRHEIPYSVKLAGGKVDMGVIDLLYKTELGWWMVDFKTDELRDEGEFLEKKNEYLPAMERYKQALQTILHETPVVILCFLSYKGSMRTARI